MLGRPVWSWLWTSDRPFCSSLHHFLTRCTLTTSSHCQNTRNGLLKLHTIAVFETDTAMQITVLQTLQKGGQTPAILSISWITNASTNPISVTFVVSTMRIVLNCSDRIHSRLIKNLVWFSRPGVTCLSLQSGMRKEVIVVLPRTNTLPPSSGWRSTMLAYFRPLHCTARRTFT